MGLVQLSPWIWVPVLAAGGWWLGQRGKGRVGTHPFAKPKYRGAPFAVGGNPVWPIHPSSRHWGEYDVSYQDVTGKWHGRAARAFRWSRDGRWHAGVDLFANAGDVVVAPEDGVVVGRQTFLNGTGAMMVQLDSGLNVLLGETRMGGAEEFGVRVGSRVKRGQWLTRVGETHAGSHMLHLETYQCCPTTNEPWWKARGRPDLLRDPTDWLLRAKAASERVA